MQEEKDTPSKSIKALEHCAFTLLHVNETTLAKYFEALKGNIFFYSLLLFQLLLFFFNWLFI